LESRIHQLVSYQSLCWETLAPQSTGLHR